MSSPLLSVCIPTFNRLLFLKEALGVLLPQAEMCGVEVCVSDNHSTDGTAQFLEALANQGNPTLRYVVQPENIGLDQNMLAVITMGKGRYIYPLGDDDVLPDGALLAILKEVEGGGDVFVLNGWHTDPSLVPTKKHLPDAIAGRSLSQPDQAFTALWNKMPFGSFLASRKCFSEHYFARFIGTSHAYTGAVWDALADQAEQEGSCTVKCMETPTVLLRGAEKTWRKNAARIMLREIPLWFDLLSERGIYRKVIKPIRRGYMRSQTTFFSFARYRVLGQLEHADASTLCAVCGRTQRLKMLFVAETPTRLLNWLINARAALKKISVFFRR